MTLKSLFVGIAVAAVFAGCNETIAPDSDERF